MTVFLIKAFGHGSFKIIYLLKFCFPTYLNVENCNADSCFFLFLAFISSEVAQVMRLFSIFQFNIPAFI